MQTKNLNGHKEKVKGSRKVLSRLALEVQVTEH